MNFSEKFQGEIQVFPGENMELYRQNLKFQGEIQYFLEKTWRFIGKILKFQVEIQVFPGENMEIYTQNLKISNRNTGISWRK